MVNEYYRLTKPGIIYGNLLTAAAGFLLGSSLQKNFNLGLMLALLAGTALIIACGCVINNYIDRNIDRKMARTDKRALAAETIPVRNALVYAGFLGYAGFVILAVYTNALTVLVGAAGLFFYLIPYSIWKRRSTHGTLVGSVSGSASIVAGYTATTNRFDTAALLLFIIMVFWQMPHFYAIAIYRLKDYKSAGLPVLPAVKGFKTTTLQIVAYIAAFTLAVASLTIFDYTGYLYLAIMVGLSLWWLHLGLQGLGRINSQRWARQMFLRSLVVMTGLSVMVPLGAWLP